MVNIIRKRMLYNNDKNEKKENVIKQWLTWKERECHLTMIKMKRKRII